MQSPRDGKKGVKVPPHSQEAEDSVLGALLIDKDSIYTVAEILRPEHFYNPANSRIFSAILDLYEKRMPIDLVTVSDCLKKKRSLKKIGGAAYLAKLANRVPTASHCEYYSQIVKDNSSKRSLIAAASKINEDAFDDSLAADEAMDRAEQMVFSLSQKYLSGSPLLLRDVLAQSFDRLDELQKKGDEMRGIATGFEDLDNLLAGFQDSNLIILAARPGIGKTAFALNIARFITVEKKQPVCFFSLEMSKEELADRLLVRQSDIDAWKMKTAKLSDDDLSRLSDAMGVLAESPLYIDDTPGLSILEMRAKARRLQVDVGIKCVIVDYLQLIKGRNLENRVQEVSEISQGLKNLARELRVPVLSLSQLSRAVESRGGSRPRLADLRESGSIEQDADVVVFLYHDDEENSDNIICEVAKHRNGPTDIINLYFNPQRISFYGVDKKR